jgi:hypothetical protein
MTVYPDGEALSDWELEILEEMEQDFFGLEPEPLYALAASLVAAEVAVVLAAFTVSVAGALVGLATIGTSLWVTSVHAANGYLAAPGRVPRGR